jgi:Tfp pilus assembly protein PilV
VRRRAAGGGFALIELLVAFILVGLGLALAAQLLMETSQMLVDIAAEQTETALPLARARLRSDIEASTNAQAIPGANGPELWLSGHPAGTVRYRKAGRDIRRDIADGMGGWTDDTVALHDVQSFSVLAASAEMVSLEIHILRRAVRHSPLPAVPGVRGPTDEERLETLMAEPRGGGLELGW